MKKTLLIVLALAGLGYSGDALAQAFTVEKDTARGIAHTSTLDIHNKITNTSSGPITFTWKVNAHTVPTSWLNNNYGICDNQTCINFSASSNLSQTFTTTPIAAGGNMDFKFTMSFPNDNSLTGGPYYIVANLNDGTTSKDVVYSVGRWSTSVATVSRNQDDVVLYPNPAKDEVNVLFNANAGVKNIAVYNLIGKPVKVYNVNGNSANLDISSIPSGIYFVRLVDNQGRVVATRKFTRQ